MISHIASAAAFLVLAVAAPAAVAQEQATTVEGVVVNAPKAGLTPEELNDRRIEQELFKAWKANPQQVVCAVPRSTTTRMAQPVCGSLQSWFNSRSMAELSKDRAPWQLVEEVKKNKRKANSRDRRG
jgi:hypothetical protein